MSVYSFNRELPLNSEYDVIVAGGGPAGCGAAIAAAREGARTLLVESSGMLGGAATLGLVNAWAPFSNGERVIYGGVAKKVLEAMKARMPHVKNDDYQWVPVDYEALKAVYDEEVTGSGAHVLFNTMLCGVAMAGAGSVDAVITANKAGLAAYKAKIYIDCTGDADICAWAGAEYEKGGESGGMQPATHCFIITNIDEYAYANSLGGRLHPTNPESCIHKIVDSGEYDIPDKHICSDYIGPKTMGFNAGHVWDVDNTDPESVSRGLVRGRRLAGEFKRALSENHPAFKNACLAATGGAIGIRETRRITGDYVFTAEDYLERRSFDDEILRNCYYIDVHRKTIFEKGEKTGSSSEPSTESFPRYEKGESHGLPYRGLTPKSLKNVLVAGRCVSSDRAAQGSLRVMPVCVCMGEAAGIAAKIAADMKNPDVHAVDVGQLRKRLREEGAYLP